MVKRSNSAAYKGSKIRLMDKILHDPKDPKLWELRYIPYYGSCRILSINRRDPDAPALRDRLLLNEGSRAFPSILQGHAVQL